MTARRDGPSPHRPCFSTRPWSPPTTCPRRTSTDTDTPLDGRPVQKVNTSELCFDVATLIAHASTLIRLKPGDLVTTGNTG
ncbi:fumarylacetoacetate hydrolase family protein [Streptomyces sp. NPDC002463]|uniref:fumarylacetoacetate hydrolase family protein n=1 Tax=Streptomyces sp. NPDC002463 TaxID=3364645 RepID=UPI00369A7CCF